MIKKLKLSRGLVLLQKVRKLGTLEILYNIKQLIQAHASPGPCMPGFLTLLYADIAMYACVCLCVCVCVCVHLPGYDKPFT